MLIRLCSIERNAKESPLLRLPLELRNRIYETIFGNRLIHIVWSETRSQSVQTNVWSHWRHIVCLSDSAENQPDGDLHSPDTARTRVMRPHSMCEQYLNGTCAGYGEGHFDDDGRPAFEVEVLQGEDYRQVVNLSLLRVCRQTYIESHEIIWATNTFSFYDPDSFYQFVTDRYPYQLSGWRSLRLEMKKNWKGAHWNHVMKMPLIKSLSGLRRLRLQHWLQFCQNTTAAASFQNSVGLGDFRWFSPSGVNSLAGLRRLSVLPFNDVEVGFLNVLDGEESNGAWSFSDRKRVAEVFRKELLDPKGPENYARHLAKAEELRQNKIISIEACFEDFLGFENGLLNI